MRVVIAEDLALLRDGLARLLRDNGFEVVAAVADGDALDPRGAPRAARHRDRRHPAAAELPRRGPARRARAAANRARDGDPRRLAVRRARRTRRSCWPTARGGVGYLLKDRILDVDDFVDAVRRVAEGGTALDPEVVAQLFSRRRAEGPLQRLTPRELEVLGLMAEGRSNAGIATALVLTVGAVEKHIASIFTKLALPQIGTDHRRVLAVLAYLQQD